MKNLILEVAYKPRPIKRPIDPNHRYNKVKSTG
jgi:hypothetical protein